MEPGATSASPVIRFTVLWTCRLRYRLKAGEYRREGVKSWVESRERCSHIWSCAR